MLNFIEIGRTVVVMRERKGLTQEKLALEAEMSVTYLRRIEHGRANPTLRALDRVAAILGMELSTLLQLSEGGQYENSFGGRISSAVSAGRNGQLYRIFLSGTGAPALCRGAGTSAAGDKMALPGCSKAIRNELEGSGAGYPYRGPCDLEFKPAAFGDSGPPGTLPKAVYGATARNPACQPVAVRF